MHCKAKPFCILAAGFYFTPVWTLLSMHFLWGLASYDLLLSQHSQRFFSICGLYHSDPDFWNKRRRCLLSWQPIGWYHIRVLFYAEKLNFSISSLITKSMWSRFARAGVGDCTMLSTGLGQYMDAAFACVAAFELLYVLFALLIGVLIMRKRILSWPFWIGRMNSVGFNFSFCAMDVFSQCWMDTQAQLIGEDAFSYRTAKLALLVFLSVTG